MTCSSRHKSIFEVMDPVQEYTKIHVPTGIRTNRVRTFRDTRFRPFR